MTSTSTSPTPDRLLARWRGIRNRRRKRVSSLRKETARLVASIARLNRTIRRRREALAGGDGAKAARYLLGFVGRTESPPGSNDAPFLRDWENRLGHDRLDWMIPGQPWCGLACIAAWKFGAGKLLPDGTVYTPNIVNWARAGEHFEAVPPDEAKPGDLVVFDFDSGGADHVGLALWPARAGLIPTVEGNTSPSDAGSQANGGGVFKRSRHVGLIAVVARPI